MRSKRNPRECTRTKRAHRLLATGVLAVLVAGPSVPELAAAGAPRRGTLAIRVAGFENDRGQLVAKLFRRGDDVPKGKSFRLAKARITKHDARAAFADVPYGTYALFVFHDENANGTVDHNLLGMPTEALGFSNGYRVTLFSGIPDFDDLKFSFAPKTGEVRLKVE